MKRLLLSAICFALGGWFIYQAVIQRADQGYVRDDKGRVYQLYRMQRFGMGSDFMAVYKSQQNIPIPKEERVELP